MSKTELITNPVKYNNKFNNANLSKLTTLEVNILFSIFKAMMYKREFSFNIDTLCNMANTSSTPIRKDRIEGILNSFVNNVFSVYIVAEDKEKRSHINLFSKLDYIYNGNKEIIGIKIVLNSDGIDILHNITNNFTMLDLEKFSRIQSTYVKAIFRLLSQYKTTGYIKIDYNQFIEILGIPNSYEFKHIKLRILEPSIKALKDYFKNIQYTAIKEVINGKRQYKWIEYKFDKIVYKTTQEIKYDKLELRTSEKQVLFYYNKVIEYNTDVIKNKERNGQNNKIEKEVNKVLYRQKRNILGR